MKWFFWVPGGSGAGPSPARPRLWTRHVAEPRSARDGTSRGRQFAENSLNRHGGGRIVGIPRLPLSRYASSASLGMTDLKINLYAAINDRSSTKDLQDDDRFSIKNRSFRELQQEGRSFNAIINIKAALPRILLCHTHRNSSRFSAKKWWKNGPLGP